MRNWAATMQQCVNCLPSLLHFPPFYFTTFHLSLLLSLALLLALPILLPLALLLVLPLLFLLVLLLALPLHFLFVLLLVLPFVLLTSFVSYRHLSRILCFSSPQLATRYLLKTPLYLYIFPVYLVFLISDLPFYSTLFLQPLTHSVLFF